MTTPPSEPDLRLMRLALEQARLAELRGEVPVGAVLQLPDGQTLAAHNAPVSRHDPTAHAEICVIREAAKTVANYRLPDAALYVTLEPCAMCAGAIVQARLARVVFGARDPKAGAVISLYRMLSDPRLNHRPRITQGVLADECGEMLKRFFRARRKA